MDILRSLLRSRISMMILRAILPLVGVALVIVGLVVGMGSKQVQYESQQPGIHYGMISITRGNLYLHAENSADWFVFQSPVDISTLPNNFEVYFVARADTTTVNVNLGKYGTVTVAHVIEQLSFADASGKKLASYSTAEYQANPNGITINQWAQGWAYIGVGVLFAILGLVFILYRKKPQTLSATAPDGMPQPVYAQVYPSELPGANPYAQPYLGQAPVGQPGTNPYQYPPQE